METRSRFIDDEPRCEHEAARYGVGPLARRDSRNPFFPRSRVLAADGRSRSASRVGSRRGRPLAGRLDFLDFVRSRVWSD